MQDDSTNNKVAGMGDILKGKVKSTAGTFTNDPSLQAEGNADELGGRIQHAAGVVEGKIREGVAEAGEMIERATDKLKNVFKGSGTTQETDSEFGTDLDQRH